MIDDIIEVEIGGVKWRLREALNGQVAHPGTLVTKPYESGIARVLEKNLNKAEGLEIVKKGDVLVTSMTDPSMENAMARAGAYVTDLGGYTCHAAMIARKLQRLCIISTGEATTTLPNNQLVFVGQTYREKEGVKRRVGLIYVPEGDDAHVWP